MSNKFYLTTPIYYVNDKPHLGHAYTTIAADVLARYHRLKKEEVFFLTGTDEHGTKIIEAAEKANKKPKEFCDQISQEFKKTWQNLNISYDYFIRTTDKKHQKTVEKILLKLEKKGVIYKSKYKGLYCSGCEKFLKRKELIDNLCIFHQKEPKEISEENYFFSLKEYLPQLKKIIEKNKIKILPPERKAEVLGLFKQKIGNFSISREKVEWGIKIPWDKSQTVYVWVDALINYLSGIEYSENSKFDRYWPVDLHLIGKDILKFHTIYWPAMLLALDLELPRQIFVHGYFTVDDQKMSKSLGNVVDPNDLIRKFGIDATRYLILSQFPFGADGDISLKRLAEKYNADLANGLGNLLNRFLGIREKCKIKRINLSKRNERKRTKLQKKYEKAFQNFQLYEALLIIWDRISYFNKYIDKKAPWILIREKKLDKLEEILYNIHIGLKEIVFLLKPFMPQTAEEIEKNLKKKIKRKRVLFSRINSF